MINVLELRHRGVVSGGVNTTANSGEQTIVYGMNGSGKTMFMRATSNKLRSTNGYVMYGKQTLSSRNCRYVDTASYALTCMMTRKQTETAILYLYQIGMADILNTKLVQLSSGQLKKLLLVRMITIRNSIWLLDEPDNFIDEVTMLWVRMKVLEHLNANGTVCITKNN